MAIFDQSNQGSGTGPAPALVRCAITGREFPPDELVVVFNQEVSQEGKEILLDRMRSGALLPGEMVRPRALTRLLSYFGDILIFVLVGSGLFIGLFTTGRFRLFRRHGGPMIADWSHIGTWLAITAVNVAVLAYFALCHAFWGKTVGKKLGRLKVVTLDGGRVGMGRAWLRAVALFGGWFLINAALLTQSTRIFVITYLVTVVYALTDIIVGLVDRQAQRTLHDRFSGTRVIEEDSWV